MLALAVLGVAVLGLAVLGLAVLGLAVLGLAFFYPTSYGGVLCCAVHELGSTTDYGSDRYLRQYGWECAKP